MSKLGFHVNHITEPDKMLQVFADTQPAIIKALHHDAVFWKEVASACPNTFLLGRRYVEEQPLEDPEQEAIDFARHISDMSVADVYDAWEGYNETPRDRRDRRYRFDRQLAEELHTYGLRYVCGSWSVGVPDIPDWQEAGMHSSLLFSDYISCHEYCAPRMNDPRGLLTGGARGWFTLRYRMWYSNLPPLCQKPLIISECGIDSGAAHWPVSSQGGWRSFVTPEQYLTDLIWYDSFLKEDDFVIGGCIYCYGTLDPRWDSYDLKGHMVDLLSAYMTSDVELPSPPPDYGLEGRVSDIEYKLARIAQILHSMS